VAALAVANGAARGGAEDVVQPRLRRAAVRAPEGLRLQLDERRRACRPRGGRSEAGLRSFSRGQTAAPPGGLKACADSVTGRSLHLLAGSCKRTGLDRGTRQLPSTEAQCGGSAGLDPTASEGRTVHVRAVLGRDKPEDCTGSLTPRRRSKVRSDQIRSAGTPTLNSNRLTPPSANGLNSQWALPETLSMSACPMGGSSTAASQRPRALR
jgi:hypothetical protein